MSDKVTYYALKPVLVGDEWREPGDLIPEARNWVTKNAEIDNHRIAPVLIVTLPQKTQRMLREWAGEAVEPEPEDEIEEEEEEEANGDTGVRPDTVVRKRRRKVVAEGDGEVGGAAEG